MLTLALSVATIVSLVALAEPPAEAPPGMVWIAGGEFTMGSTDPEARRDESPPHRVRVDGYWIDRTEVTNDQFAEFAKATGYVTIAERPVDWEELKKQLPPGTPKPDDAVLAPGSLVFTPPDHAVLLRDYTQWWSWTHGADWKHPEGPESDIADRGDHPVVQVCYEDALAYCQWVGARLPTEAEWEWAARGGLDGAPYVWGDEPPSEDEPPANIWQGVFPHQNTATDGFERTALVGSFEPNGYGLVDMAGNVWEWTSDWYRPDTYARRSRELGEGEAAANPNGPASSLDPAEPRSPKRVVRGGSFLCHASYCASYRPSARMREAIDTGMSHIGFRCVTDMKVRIDVNGDARADDPTRP